MARNEKLMGRFKNARSAILRLLQALVPLKGIGNVLAFTKRTDQTAKIGIKDTVIDNTAKRNQTVGKLKTGQYQEPTNTIVPEIEIQNFTGKSKKKTDANAEKKTAEKIQGPSKSVKAQEQKPATLPKPQVTASTDFAGNLEKLTIAQPTRLAKAIKGPVPKRPPIDTTAVKRKVADRKTQDRKNGVRKLSM
ncbi:MAG: hypothetical protein AAGB24_10775 [Bacteroidota bacterium]